MNGVIEVQQDAKIQYYSTSLPPTVFTEALRDFLSYFIQMFE
jgi:hypothetical protein